MGRYRKILVAVDGSQSGKNAFRQACKVVREDKSWITAVTVVPSFEDVYDPRNVRQEVGKALRAEGEKTLQAVEAIAKKEDVYLKTVLKEGSAFETILEVASENGFDLIVMGRRGRKDLDMALVGSVTARVIGHVNIDVLVVPESASLGWRRILLATDGSKYGDAAADRAVELAGSYGGQLAAVSVVDVTEEFQAQAPEAVERLVKKSRAALEGLMGRAEAKGVRVTPFIKEGEPFLKITGLAAELASEVIVMGSHGRTGLMRLLMGSVTEKVIGHAPCPVLVVRPGTS